MRGASPDAECPRCNHKQPPTDAPLVTCLACGLSFQPKELLRSSKKRPEQALALLPQPSRLAMRLDGDTLSYHFSERPLMGVVMTTLMVILTIGLWSSEVELWSQLFYTAVTIAISSWSFAEARRRDVVQIDRNHLRSTKTQLLLLDISRVDADCGRLTATDRYGKSHEIIRTSFDDVAAFIAEDLSRRLGHDE